jgi:hypothetical protein
MSHRHRLSTLLALGLAGVLFQACEANSDDDDDEPPPVAQPATQPVAQPTPPVGQPAQLPPTQQVAAPTQMPSAPPAAPQLLGMYELTWRQDSPSSPREVMPDALIGQIPGCIWARWGWDFAQDGGLTISNEMLCSSPPEMGIGHGVCRAEFSTVAAWRQGGFGVGAPVRTQSRFVHYRRQGTSGTFDTSTVRCSVSIGAIQATLTEVVPGPGPSRPQEVTLVLADGARMHLRAVEAEVNHPDIIVAH